MLSAYFERTDIETVFKTSKEYLGLLPLSKWTDQTVRGKILHDIIDTIVLLKLRRIINRAGISVSELAGKTQSLMCFQDKSGNVVVETPNRQAKEYYKLFDLDVPAYVKICRFQDSILHL